MAEHSPPLMSLWQPSRPPLKPLVRSRLTYKLANYCDRVIELLVMPRYDWGLGHATYLDAEAEMVLATIDLCAFFYVNNILSEELSIEIIHYILWKYICQVAGAGTGIFSVDNHRRVNEMAQQTADQQVPPID